MAQVKMPDVTKLDPEKVVVRYDAPSDTLFVHFYGPGIPGISVQIDDNVFVRLDTEERRAIGVQIESYFRSAIVARPELLSLATFADIPDHVWKSWRNQTHSDDTRLGTIDAVVQEWSAEVHSE